MVQRIWWWLFEGTFNRLVDLHFASHGLTRNTKLTIPENIARAEMEKFYKSYDDCVKNNPEAKEEFAETLFKMEQRYGKWR